MLPYKFVPYDMLRSKQAIDKLFGYENDDYVVQNFINNGGAGTFLLSNIINRNREAYYKSKVDGLPEDKRSVAALLTFFENGEEKDV